MKENTTTIFYFPLGTPYFPKTDLRLERAKWTNIEDLNADTGFETQYTFEKGIVETIQRCRQQNNK